MFICRRLAVYSLIGLSLFIFSACNRGNPTASVPTSSVKLTETATGTPEPTQTPIPPSTTPVPLAAIVNGEQITMSEYQAELERFQESQTITGTNVTSDPTTTVINELIDQMLLAQSAAQDGFIVDEASLQTRINSLETQLGSAQALEDWKAAHGYSDDEFEHALKRAVEAAWMRDQIIVSVPETTDQVHVLHILLPNSAQASEVYSQLQAGADFAELAAEYDPQAGGDLGWFPRGYLGEQAVDEAVFALQTGQYSQVVETEGGYQIFYLLERDANHPLLPDARMALQGIALRAWLSDKRQQSKIEILVP